MGLSQQANLAQASPAPIRDRASFIFTAKHVISNARMKTLRASPYTLFDVPKGHIAVVEKVVYTTPQVTTVRSAATAVAARYRLSATSLVSITAPLNSNTVAGDTGHGRSSHSNGGQPASDNFISDYDGKSVVLHNAGGVEMGGGSDNNVFTIYTSYYLMKLND